MIKRIDNSNNVSTILEILWILTNVCSGSANQTEYIMGIGGIVTLIKYISHENEDIMAQALWGLGKHCYPLSSRLLLLYIYMCAGNIAGENSECRDSVLS